jgi:hypothetical protein
LPVSVRAGATPVDSVTPSAGSAGSATVPTVGMPFSVRIGEAQIPVQAVTHVVAVTSTCPEQAIVIED